MSELTPQSVDAFLAGLLAPDDEVLAAARRNSDEAGLPSIAVSATQGKFLGVLARAVGARRILEIGTLGGYSTIWLARALAPGGRLVTLE
jgi:predicted O-methyltransferase YrrM